MNRTANDWRPRLAITAMLLALLLLAVSGCGSAPVKDERRFEDQALVSANRTARYAFSNGQYDQAAEYYSKALEQAYIRGDAAVIFAARYNLAVCLLELGKYMEALRLVDQARAGLAAEQEALPGDLLLLEATLLYRNGQPEEALAATDAILDPAAGTSPEAQARTHFLRGLIAHDQNDLPALRQSIQAMDQPGNERLQADLAELQGRLALAESDWPRAIAALDTATGLRRKYLDYRRMAITLALSAAACEKDGQLASAASRYLRAGRSAALRGDNADARQWLSQAVRLFDQIENSAMSVEAAAILSGLAEAVKPAD